MAFRTQRSPATAFAHAKSVAVRVKTYCQNRRTQFQSATNRDVVLATSNDLRGWRGELAEAAAVPGIGQYAKDQENDQAYDVVAEFNALTSAIDEVVSFIVAAFPASVNGAIEEKSLNPDGSTSYLTFTAAQLGGLVTLLDAVIAAID